MNCGYWPWKSKPYARVTSPEQIKINNLQRSTENKQATIYKNLQPSKIQINKQCYPTIYSQNYLQQTTLNDKSATKSFIKSLQHIIITNAEYKATETDH